MNTTCDFEAAAAKSQHGTFIYQELLRVANLSYGALRRFDLEQYVGLRGQLVAYSRALLDELGFDESIYDIKGLQKAILNEVLTKEAKALRGEE